MVKICNGWHDVLFMVMFACYLMMCDAKMPRLRNRSLGIGLTWPQVQQESTPSFRRGLPACCSCRTAVGDTNCCRTNLPFSHGRRVSRHCRNPCVHRAECSYVLCALSKSQAMTLRLGCRQFHGYFSISFPITSFPSMCCVGLSRNAAYAWRSVVDSVLFLS